MDCGTERGTSDWNSRAEQRERPEGDRLIALVISFRVSKFQSFKVSEFQSFRVRLNVVLFDWMEVVYHLV